MYSEHMTYAVRKTMLEIESDFSQRLSACSVKIESVHAFCHLQKMYINVSLEYVCIVIDHLLCKRSDLDGSCNICSAVDELSSGVEQQEALRLYIRVCLRCRSIMDDGSVRAVSGDSLEGQVEAVFLLTADLLQLICNVDLCQLLLFHIVLDPLDQLCYRNSVLDVRMLCACGLCVVLNDLHERYRCEGIMFLHFCRHTVVELIVAGIRIIPYGL